MRRTLVKKGWREVRQRRGQFALIVLLLGVGLALTSALSDLGTVRQDALSNSYRDAGFMDVHVRLEHGQTMNRTTLQDVLDAPGVSEHLSATEGRLFFLAFLNLTTADGYRVVRAQVIGYDTAPVGGDLSALTVNRPLLAGGGVTFSDDGAAQCLVDRELSEHFRLSKGDRISLLRGTASTELELAGTADIPELFALVPDGEYAPVDNYGVLGMPIGTASSILLGDTAGVVINDIAIVLNDPASVEEVMSSLSDELEGRGFAASVTGKDANPSYAYLTSKYARDQQGLQVIPLVVFLVTSIGLTMALSRIVSSHRHQIGVFKSLGVPDRATMLYFVSIGLLVAILGTATGLLMYPPFEAMLSMTAADTIGEVPSRLLPLGQVFLISTVVGVLLCLACTFVPAWRGLRVSTSEALRGQDRPLDHRRSASNAGGSRASLPLRLTLRNIRRRPGRSASFVLGIAVSLALFLSFVIVLQSTIGLLQGVSGKTIWDYEVKLEGFGNARSADSWTDKYPSASKVNPAIVLPVAMSQGGKEDTMVLVAAEEADQVYQMRFDQGGMTSGQMVISRYVAKLQGLEVGDTITMYLPSYDPGLGFTTRSVGFIISGVQSNLLGYYLFTDLVTLQEQTNLTGLANVFYVETVDGGRLPTLENGAIVQEGVTAVTYVDDMNNMADQYVDMLMPVTGLMSLVSATIVVTIVYNISVINAQERTREYATMRTLGASARKVRRLVLMEPAILAPVGVLLGAVGGYLMAVVMLSSIADLDLLTLQIIYSWDGLVAGIGMIAAVVIVVALATVRYIGRIDIGEMIRERSK